MRIRLESSGGIGNIRIKGEVEVESLAPELRGKVERLLERVGTEQLVEQDNPNRTDAIGYELIVFPEHDGSGVRRVLLDEATHDRETSKVCKELLREIVQRHRTKPEK